MCCCIVIDVEDIYDLDINMVYVLIKNIIKFIVIVFIMVEYVVFIVEMFDIVVGGVGEFVKCFFVKVYISLIIFLMCYGEDVVDVVYECIKYNVLMFCIIVV